MRRRIRNGPVLCISVDAMDARDLDRLLSQPVLAGLAEKGSIVRGMRTVAPSLTYPAHASIVTGRRPASHGIIHNEKDPPSGFDWDWNWYRDAIRGDTVCDAAHRAGYRVASLLWPVMGGSQFEWVLPEIAASAMKGESLTWKALRNGTPFFLLGAEWRHGRLRQGMRQPHLDDFASAVAVELLGRRLNGPDLLMLHLVDLDDAKHRHGVGSREADEACDRTAVKIGRVLAAAGVEATVLIFGDHAQIDVGRLLDGIGRMQRAGLAVRVHGAGGGAFLYPEAGYLPERDDARLERVLADWRAEPDGGLRGWLDRDGMHAQGTGDGRALALLDAADGFSFDVGHRATHGHLPDHPGISTTLFAAGPGIAPGLSIDRAEIIDIGPTVARLLGIELPEAEGTPLPLLAGKTSP